MQKYDDILTALNAVMVDLPAVGKDGRNEAQKFNFRGIDGVLNACGPALRKHGVIAAPRALQHIKEEVPRRGGGSMTHVLIELEVTWLLAGQPVDAGLKTVVWGEAFDTSDKATAKAHSVALRTAYIQTLALPTQERDPDEDYHELGGKDEQAANRKREYISRETQKILDAEKAGDLNILRQMREYYAGYQLKELVEMVNTTISRLEKHMAQNAVQQELGGQGVQNTPTAEAA